MCVCQCQYKEAKDEQESVREKAKAIKSSPVPGLASLGYNPKQEEEWITIRQ